MSTGTIEFEVKLSVELHDNGDVIVSYCPVLDIASQGITKQEAIENIKEAVVAFVSSCYDRGVLNEVLTERGFKRKSGKIEVPDKPHDYIINVPIPLYQLEQEQPTKNIFSNITY